MNPASSQLVQFASVEQQIKQNANLEKLVAGQQNGQVAAMVTYLGTTVEAESDWVSLEKDQAEAIYTHPNAAKKTTLTLKDASGQVVFSAPGEVDAGQHTFAWDSRDGQGRALPDGAYELEVSAQAADGTLADATKTVFGRVTGAGIDNGQATLFLGKVGVPMERVLSVQETQEQPAESQS